MTDLRNKSIKYYQRGFTIVELLIVIVIIAILATITIVVYSGIQEKAYASKAASTADSFSKVAVLYSINNDGNYPDTWGGPVCVGNYDDFPENNDFNDGQCADDWYDWASDDYYNVYVDDDFNYDISNAANLPSGQLPTISYDDSLIRGVIYNGNEMGGDIVYVIKGDQTCPKGYTDSDYSDTGEDITFCTITIGDQDWWQCGGPVDGYLRTNLLLVASTSPFKLAQVGGGCGGVSI